MIISVHVPKTGGSTFRHFLKQNFGDGFLRDYGNRPMKWPLMISRTRALTVGRLEAYRKALGPGTCVHGHFFPIKYRHLKSVSFAIWMRDPLQRIVSGYHFFKRNSSPYKGTFFNRYITSKDISLEEYAAVEHYQNIYTKYLWGMKLEDFDFVGITERYDRSIQLFKSIYKIGNDSTVVIKNANANRKTEQYEISDTLATRIRAWNAADIALYQNALEFNKELELRHNPSAE